MGQELDTNIRHDLKKLFWYIHYISCSLDWVLYPYYTKEFMGVDIIYRTFLLLINYKT